MNTPHLKTLAATILSLSLIISACGTTPTPTASTPAAASEPSSETGWVSGVPSLSSQTIQSIAGGTNTLTRVPWTSATNGWGPIEIDRSNGGQAAGDGRVLTLNGKTYTSGFGTNAASSMTFDIDARCQTFTVGVGIDDEVGSAGSAVFEIHADGVKVYDSGRMTGKSATKNASVSVSGKKLLKLVVTDGGDGPSSDHADWVSPTLLSCTAPAPAPAQRFLSDLAWSSASNGYGPVERDMSNGEAAAGDGRALTLQGVAHAKGLGVHAGSTVAYALDGTTYASFRADVGLDDEVGTNGAATFQVWVDGALRYDSGELTGASVTAQPFVDIRGARELKLIVTPGASADSDHADWASARLSTALAPAAPAPVPAPIPTPVPAPAPGTVTYGGKLVITRGGTYTGNWESTDTGAAVTIQTSEPVVIENANIRGQGALIAGFGVNLTVRNTRGISLTPNVLGRAAEMAIKAEEIRNLRVEDSTFTGGGIYVRRFVGDQAAGQGIRILRNVFVNIDGRKSNGAGGYSGSEIRQMVQFNDVTGIGTAQIAWNQNINEAFKSAGEDLINMYASSGRPGAAILIHDNYLEGSYPANPLTDSHYGGGILLGDGTVSVAENNGYQSAYNNQVVSTTNYGMAIIGGTNNRIENNRVISSGRTPDGTRVAAQNVGLYVWDMYNTGSMYSQNVMQNNVSGWTKVAADGSLSNNNWWLPNGTTNGSVVQNNTALGTQTRSSEQAEFSRWQQKLSSAGITIGAR